MWMRALIIVTMPIPLRWGNNHRCTHTEAIPTRFCFSNKFMPTFDPGGGSEKKNKLIKSVKNLIKKHYHIKMSDVCNKMKVHRYNSLHLPVSSRDQFRT